MPFVYYFSDQIYLISLFDFFTHYFMWNLKNKLFVDLTKRENLVAKFSFYNNNIVCIKTIWMTDSKLHMI